MATTFEGLEAQAKMAAQPMPSRMKISKYFLTFSPNKRFEADSAEAQAYITQLEGVYDEVLGSKESIMNYVIILNSPRVPETDLAKIEEGKARIVSIEGRCFW